MGDQDLSKHAWADARFAADILAEHAFFFALLMPEELAAKERQGRHASAHHSGAAGTPYPYPVAGHRWLDSAGADRNIRAQLERAGQALRFWHAGLSLIWAGLEREVAHGLLRVSGSARATRRSRSADPRTIATGPGCVASWRPRSAGRITSCGRRPRSPCAHSPLSRTGVIFEPYRPGILGPAHVRPPPHRCRRQPCPSPGGNSLTLTESPPRNGMT